MTADPPPDPDADVRPDDDVPSGLGDEFAPDDEPTSLDEPTDVDAMASAYLDGELSDPAAVEGDAELLQRVAELQAARDCVATPVEPLADAERRRLLQAALDQADGRAHRAAPGRKRIWLPHPAVAAAVVAVIAAVGIGLIVSGLSHHRHGATDSTFAAAGPSVSVPKGSPETIPDLGRFSGQTTMTRAIDGWANALVPGTFGAESDAASTPQAAKPASGAATVNGAATNPSATQPPASTTTTSTTTPPASSTYKTTSTAITRCEQVIEATDSTLEARTAVASAVLASRRVLIYRNPVTPTHAGATPVIRITVADATSCSVLFAVQS